jgi:hypothetical protein
MADEEKELACYMVGWSGGKGCPPVINCPACTQEREKLAVTQLQTGGQYAWSKQREGWQR